MLNTALLKTKYGEESEKKFVTIQKSLQEALNDKKIIETSEEIVKKLVGLKLDIDSVCAGFAYTFVKKNSELKQIIQPFAGVCKILNSMI